MAPEHTEHAESEALDAPLSRLPGVGPARALLLERLGLESLRDLLFHAPRRLESSGLRRSLAQAAQADPAEVVVFSGVLTRKRFQRFGRRSSLRLEIRAGDDSLDVAYFNQAWQREHFEEGERYTFAGRVTRSEKGPLVVAPRAAAGAWSLPVGDLVAVYGTIKGLGQGLLRSLMGLALERCGAGVEEPLEAELLARLELLPLPAALRELHRPTSRERFAGARRRVFLEDLLLIQARVLQRRREPVVHEPALVLPSAGPDAGESALRLPFALTAGQREVLQTLGSELASGRTMRRLLQGDVGVGKTVLALLIGARVARAGGQCAFMAPTELLAEQHFYGSREMWTAAGLRAELLTGSVRAAERRALLQRLAAGQIDLLFGTHALFSRDVHYARLALCVIDEQQRFGVAQRTSLLRKGGSAHLLLMTATPIPRSLALTVYGDLELSVLRERPAGRGELRTRWLRPKDGERLEQFLHGRLAAGERIYWVCPRIGAAGEGGAEAAFARLSGSRLASKGIALVHGQMDRELRAEGLDAFRRGDLQCLVASTVIEVGVDVPEATVIVIEEAERLGLAQLHQLRGRVGRGERSSWCLLFGKPTARQRFEFLEQSNDGFEIAEEDLRQRGMGDLAGLRQSGELGGLLTALERDHDLLLAARELLATDAGLRRAYRVSHFSPGF